MNGEHPSRIRLPGGRTLPHVPHVLPEGDPLPAGDTFGPPPAYTRRRQLLALLLLLALLAGLLWLLLRPRHPSDLHDSYLSGVRRTYGPVCLDLVVDFSGSMQKVAATRDAALDQLTGFIGQNLRSGDVLSSVAFTDRALLTLPPTAADGLRNASISRSGPADGPHTLISPALEALRDAYRTRGIVCAAHALIIVSDVELSDSPDKVAALFTDLRLDRTYWAIPGHGDGTHPGLAAERAMRPVISRGFHSAGGLSLIYGDALAGLTGQRLRKR
jgi:hypothetical protein